MSPPSARSVAGWLRLLLFGLGLFALFNLVDGFAFFRAARYQLARGDAASPLANAAVIAAAYGLCIAGLVVLYAHRSKLVRWPAFALTVVALALHLGFRSTNGYGFTYHEASLIWANPENIGDALVFFGGGALAPLALTLLLTAAIAFVSRRFVPRIGSLALCLLPLAGGWAAWDLLDRTYAKVYETPLPYRVPLLAAHAFAHRTLYYGEREEPYLEPRQAPFADHVLFIVDESVGGDFLDLAGARLGTTPFLRSVRERILDFGIASSVSNLTATSQIVMQSGLRPDQIPDRELRSLKNPNVFSYFQRAGFRAYLVDAQHYSARPTNLMSGYDLAALDGWVVVRENETGRPTWAMDLAALDDVERIVSANERSFVYLIKTGAHVPYDEKYPPDEALFQPTRASGGAASNREKTENSYKNAVRWTVDRFMQELFERFATRDEEILVVYTSDHGQSIRQASETDGEATGRDGLARWTHALPVDPPVEQAMVPLLVFGLGDDLQERLEMRFDPSLRDRASGFEIFPTLLALAGYAEAEITARYGPTIFASAASRRPRGFVSGNLFGIGGGFYDHPLVQSAVHWNDFDRRAPPAPATTEQSPE